MEPKTISERLMFNTVRLVADMALLERAFFIISILKIKLIQR